MNLGTHLTHVVHAHQRACQRFVRLRKGGAVPGNGRAGPAGAWFGKYCAQGVVGAIDQGICSGHEQISAFNMVDISKSSQSDQRIGQNGFTPFNAGLLHCCNENNFYCRFPPNFLPKLPRSGSIDTTSEMEVGPGIRSWSPLFNLGETFK